MGPQALTPANVKRKTAPEQHSEVAAALRRNALYKPEWEWLLNAENPWEAALNLDVRRYSWSAAGDIIDPGVNFFVLALEHLGAEPEWSCEGHPNGFYVLFHASYKLATMLHSWGYFSVEIERGKRWSMRINRTVDDKDRVFTLRLAALAWREKIMQLRPKSSHASRSVQD